MGIELKTVEANSRRNAPSGEPADERTRKCDQAEFHMLYVCRLYLCMYRCYFIIEWRYFQANRGQLR